MLKDRLKRFGDIGRGLLWALLAALVGLPFPIVLMFFLCGGCGTN